MVEVMTEPVTDERLAEIRADACGWSGREEMAYIDRLRAELAAKEAECERLLRENLELTLQPVFDEYRP